MDPETLDEAPAAPRRSPLIRFLRAPIEARSYAAVPPMSSLAPASPGSPRGFWRTVGDFLGNPVTWKGMGYLLIKLPLGIVTFAVTTFLLSLSAALLLAPFAYPFGLLELDGVVFTVDGPWSALLCGVIGLLIAFLSLHAFNGLAWVWRTLASAMLGSERFAAPAV